MKERFFWVCLINCIYIIFNIKYQKLYILYYIKLLTVSEYDISLDTKYLTETKISYF